MLWGSDLQKHVVDVAIGDMAFTDMASPLALSPSRPLALSPSRPLALSSSRPLSLSPSRPLERPIYKRGSDFEA